MGNSIGYDGDTDGDFRDIVGDSRDVTDLQNTVDEELDNILNEVNADSDDTTFQMKVYRTLKDKGTLEWCFDFTPAELPILGRLRDEYDGGIFQVRILKNGKIFKRKNIHIAKPPKQPTNVNTPNSDVEVILKYVTSGMAQIAEAVKAMGDRQSPEQYQQIQPVNPAASMSEMMALMLQMKQLTDGQVPTPQKGMEFKDMIELVKMGSEMSGGGPDPLVQAMQTFGPLVSKVIEGQPTQASHQQSQALGRNASYLQSQALGQNPVPKTPPIHRPKGDNPMSLKEIFIKRKLTELVECAKQNKDPSLYAELVMDQVPSDVLMGLINAPDTKEELSKIAPEISAHWDWFKAMIDVIKDELIDPEPEPEPEPEPVVEVTKKIDN